jgi:RHS repeat-associated protein
MGHDSNDDAGQVMWEGNEIAGTGGRTQTNYYRYPSGEVAHLHYPGGNYIRHDYTARGQLAATGWDDDDNNWWMKLAAYTYLPDGKVGQVDYGKGVRTALGYDERGFTQIVDHYNVPANQDYSWRQYWRDDRDRITAFQKSYNPGANPMENGRGDRFRYDEEGQLVEGCYNATDPANSCAGNTRYDGFNYDALGNRMDWDFIASRGQWMNFTRKDNGLNQYRAWWPYSYTNYDDDIGGTWGAPGAANGVLMQDGWVTAGFNALNQPMYITSPTYYGTSNWMYFGYDPLGRCVKRWVGESGDVYSNPATYFHYDGWNLLQEGNNAWGPARVYVHGNRVDEIVWSYNTFTGEQAFHHYDARGHCTLLTDSTGNILEQYEYDAFGWPYFYDASGNSIGAYDPVQNLWEGYSQFGNRFLFTGREWLSDLRLYDLRNRLYQPELGRFLQPDPKEFAAGDYNLYRYCHNDPVNRSDPMGLEFFDLGYTRENFAPGAEFGITQPVLTVPQIILTPTAGGYTASVPRFDLTVHSIVATQGRNSNDPAWHGKGPDVFNRSKENIDRTIKHEGDGHRQNNKNWYYSDRDRVLKDLNTPTIYKTPAEAKTAIERKLQNNFEQFRKGEDTHTGPNWKGYKFPDHEHP